ncbi:exodeoxyribonuclease VII large subunit [Litoreibacter halocynthiae]|uniref:Exodeoxyribonuclease 7 large subunit n=1 Tax=Litoreibacter halocynthiae TaxID=1242689 RepID=A0A4V3EVX9_9RHOB|nr:exodeoxyribonuclease VII large subunit [Litoreibacter halocynthiae]TDT74815.1 exodeoxyribonuclease VII large subunit [Litoreibacter halocynthiae]
MDLLEDDTPGRNEPEYTVSEISGAVKRTIEGEFGRVRIKGEVGRVMVARSGHVYLDLKDDRAVLASIIWKGQAAKLAVQPEEGMEVVAIGKLTTFPGQSKYQMVIEDIRPAGVGALMAMLEKRKKALEAEGLFDPARKKPIPYLPEIIGVVTSPQGAVIRDILHRLRDRFPRKVLIWPVAVQGEGCAPQVTAAIEGFNAMTPGGSLPRPDLIIVARGGGSIEDLWGFNEESVARAAAASDIPLISAVGHETDTTLIDYVSDIRAPTPTAAAEIAVPVRLDLLAAVDSYGARMAQALSGMVGARKQRLTDLSRALPRASELTQTARQRFDLAGGRLDASLKAGTATKRLSFEKAASPLRPSILARQTERMTARLTQTAGRLHTALDRRAERSRAQFDHVSGGLSLKGIQRDLGLQRDRLGRTTRTASQAGCIQVKSWRDQMEKLDRLRETLGYQATLERGYAVVWDGDKVVTNSTQAQKVTTLEVQFKDARIPVGAAAKAAPKPKPLKPGQPSLFDD